MKTFRRVLQEKYIQGTHILLVQSEEENSEHVSPGN